MFPYEIKPVDGKDAEFIKEHFKGKVTDLVSVGPKKWMLPVKYEKHADKYYNFDLRSDDVWIVTYMKSGTTLTQELVWMITNNLDYEKSSKIPLLERCPFLDFNILWNDEYKAYLAELNGNDPKVCEELKDIDVPCYETAEKMISPRVFKTHLSPSLLPPSLIETCKVIYVARNPLDVAVSYYHHCKLVTSYGYQSDFKTFWQFFEKDLLMYSPYWEHIKEGWANKHHPNFLFLFYEDLVRDMPGNIRKVAKFLNKEMTHDDVIRLADHLHVDNFRKNVTVANVWKTVSGILDPEAQGFIRRGKVGGNKEVDDEIKLMAEKWFKENLAKTDIKFPEF
uniref:Putative sulfotransferase n=1 Tax=Triatoma infestans TaxID=30076 RepID=A0A023F737_TRIIF